MSMVLIIQPADLMMGKIWHVEREDSMKMKMCVFDLNKESAKVKKNSKPCETDSISTTSLRKFFSS